MEQKEISTTYNGVDFKIVDNKLVRMEHKGKKRVDVFIPHKFPTGEVITSIGSGFCGFKCGSYNKIVVDDNISVIDEGAFKRSAVNEVVWPASCCCIPRNCFNDSDIRKLSNIEHITSIGERAFMWSRIPFISWPQNCTVIPEACFCKSSLEEIVGLGVVERIDNLAFARTSLSKPIDLSGCIALRLSKSAFLKQDSQKIILPYYYDGSSLI